VCTPPCVLCVLVLVHSLTTPAQPQTHPPHPTPPHSYRINAAALNACKEVGLLVCDEAHRLKSGTDSKTMNALAASPSRARLLLTGTPVQNNLEEFWALVRSGLEWSGVEWIGLLWRVFDDTVVGSGIHSNPAPRHPRTHPKQRSCAYSVYRTVDIEPPTNQPTNQLIHLPTIHPELKQQQQTNTGKLRQPRQPGPPQQVQERVRGAHLQGAGPPREPDAKGVRRAAGAGAHGRGQGEFACVCVGGGVLLGFVVGWGIDRVECCAHTHTPWHNVLCFAVLTPPHPTPQPPPYTPPGLPPPPHRRASPPDAHPTQD
jgi:hypothetical protein